MGFQEEMQSNFRTKGELLIEKNRVFHEDVKKTAQTDFIDIQNGLLHQASLGQYRSVSGVKAVIYSFGLYNLHSVYEKAGRRSNWLSIDVEDKSIHAKFHPITHKLIRHHEFHNIVKFSVVEDDGLRLYLSTLKNYVKMKISTLNSVFVCQMTYLCFLPILCPVRFMTFSILKSTGGVLN